MKIKVEALKDHTYNGKSYKAGDTYDFEPSTDPANISPDDQVQSLLNTGFAIRVDHAAHAKKAEEKPKADEKKTAVEPMSTTDKGSKAIAKPQAKK